MCLNVCSGVKTFNLGNAVRFIIIYFCVLVLAQAAFENAAEAMEVNGEEDIQALAYEVRYGKEK